MLGQLLVAFVAAALADPIETTSGRLTGTAGTFDPAITAYLGIPYANPPIGENRWTAPRRYKSSAPRDASKFAQDCPGTYDLPGALSKGNATDDCLYLNIWAPKQDDKKRAVMVWIHGGAFVGGGTSGTMYDGSRLASREDVVVVTVNYRLSIFGFPGAPGLKDQNLGLLDQRSAVEWVRDNIAAFGGDIGKITLFGESAGADSVDLYAYAWTSDPIIAGLIAESGAATMCGLVGKQSFDSWATAANLAGCTDKRKALDCMRSKTVQEIQKAAKSIPRNGTYPPTFVPVIDDKIVFDDYFERGSKGLFIPVPFITGNNDAELGAKNAGGYGAEGEFICPAAQVANTRRNAGVPVWRYRFYGGGPAATPGGGKELGINAAHAAELPFIFGQVQGGWLKSGIAAKMSAQSKSVSEHMQSVWAAFAKDPENGPISKGWPAYDPEKDTLVRLMYKDEAKISFEKGNKYDANCSPQICNQI